MFTNRQASEKFDKQILKNIKKFDILEIATGYFGSEIIERFEKDLIEISKKGHCKILIGMIFHGGVNKRQKQTLEKINKKLRKAAESFGLIPEKAPVGKASLNDMNIDLSDVGVDKVNLIPYGKDRDPITDRGLDAEEWFNVPPWWEIME